MATNSIIGHVAFFSLSSSSSSWPNYRWPGTVTRYCRNFSNNFSAQKYFTSSVHVPLQPHLVRVKVSSEIINNQERSPSGPILNSLEDIRQNRTWPVNFSWGRTTSPTKYDDFLVFIKFFISLRSFQHRILGILCQLTSSLFGILFISLI